MLVAHKCCGVVSASRDLDTCGVAASCSLRCVEPFDCGWCSVVVWSRLADVVYTIGALCCVVFCFPSLFSHASVLSVCVVFTLSLLFVLHVPLVQ